MKTIFASVLLALGSLLFAGCESDIAPDPHAKSFSPSSGSLTQPDQSEDPLIKENTRLGN